MHDSCAESGSEPCEGEGVAMTRQTDGPGQSQPIGVDLSGYGVIASTRLLPLKGIPAWNFLLRIQILKVSVAEPVEVQWTVSLPIEAPQQKCPHWSEPTRRPDLASPMYCI